MIDHSESRKLPFTKENIYSLPWEGEGITQIVLHNEDSSFTWMLTETTAVYDGEKATVTFDRELTEERIIKLPSGEDFLFKPTSLVIKVYRRP